MKGTLKQLLLLAFSVVVFSTSLIAQTDSINILSTAVPFLRISPDARSGGMGDLAVATLPDANSPFWNVGKIPFALTKSSISLNYTPWLKDLGLNDVYLASMSGFYKLDEVSAISSTMRYFSLGNIQLTDNSGNILNSVKPAEFAIDFGYSRKLSENFSIGGSLRYINSRLVTGDVGTGVVYKAGNSVAADVGVYYHGLNEEGAGLTWGLSLTNLGAKNGYTNDAKNKDFLPANLGLGVSYTAAINESNRLSFGLDLNKLLVPVSPSATGVYSTDSANLAEYRSMGVAKSWVQSFSDGTSVASSFQASIGVEYAYAEQFFFRTGYFYEDKTRGNRKYFTVGAGFNAGGFGLNISYLVPSGSGVTRNPLSNTVRFGLVFHLAQED